MCDSLGIGTEVLTVIPVFVCSFEFSKMIMKLHAGLAKQQVSPVLFPNSQVKFVKFLLR
jgi:hypothetical protein